MNSKKINSPKKNSVGRATLTKQMSTDFSNMPSNEEVERQFVQVLDSLLTPPHVKEQLIKSQSKEKKWTTVLLHQEGSNITTTGKWGDRDNSLLAQIQKAKTPDVQMILRLKTSLSSANKDYMKAFLEAGGVSLLLKAVDSSINRKPMTQMDIAILYEILSCFKAVMNNSTGMDGFLAIDGSVDILTRCLKFEYKMFVLLVSYSCTNLHSVSLHQQSQSLLLFLTCVGVGNAICVLLLFTRCCKSCGVRHAYFS